jgi:hypothetical protein
MRRGRRWQASHPAPDTSSAAVLVCSHQPGFVGQDDGLDPRRGLQAPRVIAETAPDSSVILAYDAARQACVALLAQQGLRPTTAGHVSGWRPFSR